jgi:hypothetical protein
MAMASTWIINPKTNPCPILMPQVWGLLINQINRLIRHWDCKTKVVRVVIC